MKIIIDTPIWSLALRRRRSPLIESDQRMVQYWRALVDENSVALLGPVRQECLSGIRELSLFDTLRTLLRGFDDIPMVAADFEEAARCSNRCRAAGIAGSAVDFLLCGAAIRRRWPIFTTDRDFDRYKVHLPIKLIASPKR